MGRVGERGGRGESEANLVYSCVKFPNQNRQDYFSCRACSVSFAVSLKLLHMWFFFLFGVCLFILKISPFDNFHEQE